MNNLEYSSFNLQLDLLRDQIKRIDENIANMCNVDANLIQKLEHRIDELEGNITGLKQLISLVERQIAISTSDQSHHIKSMEERIRKLEQSALITCSACNGIGMVKIKV